MKPEIYQIKLPQFEGPFDLLLFFIERDELDIYNIPITRITNDFLEYIHQSESLNIELSSDFILFVSTLMHIKARMLLPRKELDSEGNEIDPRQELVDKLVKYKRYKEAAKSLSDMEAERMLRFRRGNIQSEMIAVGEEAAEGTEIQSVTLFKLMRAFERVAKRLHEKHNKPVHTVIRYNYTMEGARKYVFELVKAHRSISFEKIFDVCENRIHALFLFLNMLELIQQNFLKILIGEGVNNFILEFNEEVSNDLPSPVDPLQA
ncbi:MAG: segregation/condensation protein A [Chitinophagaceae bacterium]|nr:segregation/condensation protein A [Chitinophagaceae bacterium]